MNPCFARLDLYDYVVANYGRPDVESFLTLKHDSIAVESTLTVEDPLMHASSSVDAFWRSDVKFAQAT